MIDNLRLSRENMMLRDLQETASTGGDLESRGRHGESPVSLAYLSDTYTFNSSSMVTFLISEVIKIHFMFIRLAYAKKTT